MAVHARTLSPHPHYLPIPFSKKLNGETTHAFAARRGRNIFLSPIFLPLFLFWLRLGRAKSSAPQSVRICACCEDFSGPAK